MTENDNTTEKLKCREAFELYANDINDKTDRIPLPLGKNTIPQDFYIDGDTAIAFEDFKAGWKAANSTRADSGEAVAWLHIMHMEHGQTARLLTESSTNPWGTRGKHYDESYAVTSVPLFTHPSATSDEVKDAERYRWLRDHSQPGACAFYLSVGMALHGVRFMPETVDSFIDAALSQRVEKGKATEVGL